MHWVWGGGWLQTTFSHPFADFSGSGVVHMTGGFCGLIGAIKLGERTEKRNKTISSSEYGNNPMMVTGIMILWFGWYGLNTGSGFKLIFENTKTVANIAINTTVAAGVTGISNAALRPFVEYFNTKKADTFKSQWLQM